MAQGVGPEFKPQYHKTKENVLEGSKWRTSTFPIQPRILGVPLIENDEGSLNNQVSLFEYETKLFPHIQRLE
jgi:hypothetical protein